MKANGVLGQLIASESFSDDPIVVYGGGPRIRLYCLYNEAAVEGDDAADERALTASPTEGDWAMSVPCSDDDHGWVTKELAKHGKRITARRAGESVDEKVDESPTAHSATVNIEAFLRA